MSNVFLTGATGYIGGDALSIIVEAHPEWSIRCLVRNNDKGALITAKYPGIQLVYGELDSVDIIEQEAKDADIVYHFADCDHEPSAIAIAKGLANHTPDRPGYWIHTSGTGILTYPDFANTTFGQATNEPFDDWDGIEKVLDSIPDHARHRLVDKIVIEAGTKLADRVKTAIVCPPTIYGPGRGPGKTRGAQAYNLANSILAAKQGVLIGKGTNVWTQVHVWDLSNLYLLLGGEAANGGGKATWGREGYYFAENGLFVWGDVARALTGAAFEKGLIPSPTLKSVIRTLDADRKELAPSTDLEPVSDQEAKLLRPFLHYMVLRAKKILGWTPRERLLIEETPDIIEFEAKLLGLY
ncbi:unnamed protein product [Clonostachys solani]|uniref:Uncharacterized protein n=1 Tax=Clonostachys solani TaxID=160281 RepID=A0A9N9Z1G0_9HYPO|nr:unnamed protein product [Clonostachys solani]